MFTTEHRPAALPPRAGAATAGAVGPVKPAEAAKMAKVYLDASGKPMTSPFPVPVDVDDRRTEHLLHTCRKTIAVQGEGGRPCGHGEWLLPGRTRYCPDHGKSPLVAETPSPWLALAPFLRDAHRLHRESVRPWLVLAANVAAGIGVELGHVDPLQTLPAIPAAGAVAYAVANRQLRRRAIRNKRLEPGEKTGRRARAITRKARLAAAAGAASGAWWATAAMIDPATWMGRVAWAGMVGGWAMAAYPWWVNADQRRMRAEPILNLSVPTETPALPDPVQVRAVATWAALIGCQGGPLAGTVLESFTRLPACTAGDPNRPRLPNWTAKVTATVPGSMSMREGRPLLLGRIAAAYRCTLGDVSFVADESDLSVAYVRVQPDNLLAQVRMWQGPAVANDWRRGLSTVGRFDDQEPLLYRWWSNTGAVHELISGCTGSGKSEFVAQLLLNSLHSGGLVLDWVGDPQGGQSYGQLKREVDWFARDLTEIKLMLLAAKKEMLRRNDALSEADIKTWQATQDMPLLVITLDEVQSYIFDPAVLQLVTDLCGMGRKCGIKLRLITQIPAAYNLGDSTYIKEQTKAGQTFIFRAADDVSGRQATDGDCPINPVDLPPKWGKGTCAPGETTAGLLFVQGVAGRDVFGRTDWTGDDMRHWLVDTDGKPTRTPGVFSDAAQMESGVLWGDRKARAQLALMSGRSDADLLPKGLALELIEGAAVTPARSAGNAQTPTPAPVVPSAPARARDVVLAAAKGAADANGVVTKPLLVAATPEVAEGTRDAALTDLVADGALRRIKNGLYSVS